MGVGYCGALLKRPRPPRCVTCADEGSFQGNHPNIGAIYGFEESNSVRALVLELAEGRRRVIVVARECHAPLNPSYRRAR